MNKRYIFFAALLIALGAGLLFIPEPRNLKEVSPEQLLSELFDQTRYVTTDEVAGRIINQDPSIFLIDVRESGQYGEYSIPGAANIPLKEIVNADRKDYLTQDGMDVVFFSNSDIYAEQAWMLATRIGYKNLYVMKGGLNCWFETIIKPEMPKQTASSEAFDLYEFRKGAAQYFTGGGSISTDDNAEPVVVTRKKKKSAVEGGC